jgi:hypothetical protein
VMTFHVVENLIPLKESADKNRMFRTFLKGQALFYFEHHLRRRLKAEDSDISDNELIEPVHTHIGLEYIPKRAIIVQKLYLRQLSGSYIVLNTSVQKFEKR